MRNEMQKKIDVLEFSVPGTSVQLEQDLTRHLIDEGICKKYFKLDLENVILQSKRNKVWLVLKNLVEDHSNEILEFIKYIQVDYELKFSRAFNKFHKEEELR
jgi:hypothetical protein